MAKKSRKKPTTLTQINPNAAGIDIGASSHFVAIPMDRCDEPVQEFQHFTSDLYRLAHWLKEHKIKTVAMESTGIYWLPLYEILEAEGFEVILVNARHVNNVPGRKTDVLDCQWIQQLHSFGLLRGAFQPDQDITPLRAYTRHRANWVTSASKHIQHMQKSLRLMNLNLDQVVTDITGVTGMKIINALLEGVRDPHVLAAYRDRRCKKSEEDIAHALDGHYREEYLFTLRQAKELFEFFQVQIKDCDDQLQAYMNDMDSSPVDGKKASLDKTAKKRGKARNSPSFDLRSELYRLTGVDLTRVDGIDSYTGLKVISETGTDMNRWKSEKQFCSWLCLSPGSKISGGKIISGKTKKSSNRAAAALRMSAQGLSNSKSALGAFYRRKRYHLGTAKAITATAHKLARIIYSLLKNGSDYKDPGEDAYEQKYKQRSYQNLKRKATKLGYILVSKETGEVGGALL